MKERVKWIDIAKFFGIFAIYLGHFGELAGRSYPFVFTHHVPLFFFISGCVENYNKEENIIKYGWKKIKTIIIPFWVFAVLSAIVSTLDTNCEFQFVKAMIVEILRGVVRNTFVAASLWFLTCLFVMQMIFFVLRKLKYRPIIFLACVILYIIAMFVLEPHPLMEPSWYYNVDSAFYYIIYYGLGYVLYPYIEKLFELNSWKKKIIFAVTGAASLFYTAYMFFGMDLLSFIPFPELAQKFTPILVTTIMIYAYFVVSKLFEDANVLAQIGKNTLYLCGSEYLVKVLVEDLVFILGIEVALITPLSVYIYVGILLFVANKYLVPIEKYIINKIVR